MTISEYEDVIKRFLRKMSPDSDWQYIGEVEHVWMAELYDKLAAEFKEENDKLRGLVEYMHRCYVMGHDWGPYGAPEKWWVEEQMRELGIEVDE